VNRPGQHRHQSNRRETSTTSGDGLRNSRLSRHPPRSVRVEPRRALLVLRPGKRRRFQE